MVGGFALPRSRRHLAGHPQRSFLVNLVPLEGAQRPP